MRWYGVRAVIQIYKFMWSDMNCTGAQNVAFNDGILRATQQQEMTVHGQTESASTQHLQPTISNLMRIDRTK